MVIFNSYVELPEGMQYFLRRTELSAYTHLVTGGYTDFNIIGFNSIVPGIHEIFGIHNMSIYPLVT